jgi:hypothetical protein
MLSWLVRRKTMEAALEGQRGLYNGLLCEKEHEIARLREEVARLRDHFDATCRSKDEAYRVVMADRDAYRDELSRTHGRLMSLGILPPGDWAHPTPRHATVSVVADINGIRRVPVGPTTW